MNKVMAFIRSNPITAVSAVFAVLAISFLGYLLFTGDLASQLKSRLSEVRGIESFSRTTVVLPPERADAEPEEVSGVTVNRAFLEQVGEIYKLMEKEHESIFRIAIDRNRAGHKPMMDGLLPRTTQQGLAFKARDVLKEKFHQMLGQPKEGLPGLNAGTPPSSAVIDEALEKVAEEQRANYFKFGGENINLTEEEQAKLIDSQRRKLMELLRNRAASINVYADMSQSSIDYPFDVPDWTNSSAQPTLAQLWEGQLSLWIQQDIVAAIARANGVGVEGASVQDAPVKRLIKIDVLDGYPGLHTLGGLTGQEAKPDAQGRYHAPLNGMTGSPDEPMPDNFGISPSGRGSNAIYDVRHVRVRMIADWLTLPVLLREIGNVNLMTVLSVQTAAVDDFAELDKGYYYGSGDAVEVEMVIETVWLREWTSLLMPDVTKQYLGISEPTSLLGSASRQ